MSTDTSTIARENLGMISDEDEPPPQQEAAQDSGDVNEKPQAIPASRIALGKILEDDMARLHPARGQGEGAVVIAAVASGRQAIGGLLLTIDR